MTLKDIVQELLDQEESFMVSGGEVFPIIETDLVGFSEGELCWNVYTEEEVK